MPAKIYSYGARPPTAGLEVVEAQMHLAHRYRNLLVSVERHRRDAVEAAVRRHFPALADLEPRLADADAAVESAAKALAAEHRRLHAESGMTATRSRKATAPLRNALKSAKDARRELYARRKALRAEAFAPRPRPLVDAAKALADLHVAGNVRRGVTAAQLAAAEARVDEARADWHRAAPLAAAFAADLDAADAKAAARNRAAYNAVGAPCWPSRRHHGRHALADRALGGPEPSRVALGWGTRLVVAQTMGTARSGAPPEFRAWRRSEGGKVAVQLQGGLPVRQALAGTRNWLRVTVPPSGDRATALLRVGSAGEGGRDPVWAQIPFTLHRPLPDGAAVKWAWLRRYRVGPDDRWSLQFVLESPDGFPTARPRGAGGVVALNFGWRHTDAGLRVAYWMGDDGRHGELVLPEAEMTRWSGVTHLRGVRDALFDGARDVLAAWLAGGRRPEWVETASPEPGGEGKRGRRTPAEPLPWLAARSAYLRKRLPDPKPAADRALRREAEACEALASAWPARAGVPGWLAERTRTLYRWRSPAALREVCELWYRNRFDGDGTIFDFLAAWRRRDLHLERWAANQASQAQGWRLDTYRRFAADLSGRYAAAVVDDTDWRDFQSAPKAEEVDPERMPAEDSRRVAAVSELQRCVTEAFGAGVEVAPAAGMTETCPACGGPTGEVNPANLFHACVACGITTDQDEINTRNKLEWYDANRRGHPRAAG